MFNARETSSGSPSGGAIAAALDGGTISDCATSPYSTSSLHSTYTGPGRSEAAVLNADETTSFILDACVGRYTAFETGANMAGRSTSWKPPR